jgi:hypothetical protein
VPDSLEDADFVLHWDPEGLAVFSVAEIREQGPWPYDLIPSSRMKTSLFLSINDIQIKHRSTYRSSFP